MRDALAAIAALHKRFASDSSRVQRLQGMALEAQNKMTDAQRIYDAMLERDPNSLHALKRQVAMLRALDKPAEAAAKLADHLAVVSSDADSWLTLAHIHLGLLNYRRAAFCMEELILLAPMAYLYHVRYAEILYTQASATEGAASAELLCTARTYFAHALELKPAANLRALYGLLLCCAATPKDPAARRLASSAQTALLGEYGGVSSSLTPIVRSMLATLLS